MTDESSSLHSTPREVRAAWVAAVAAGNAEALRPLLADDYELWPNAAAPVRGPEAVVDVMRQALERHHIIQEFESIETIVAGAWAFERGIERLIVRPIAGGPPQTITQRTLLVFRRGDDGRWRFARGMTNALRPNGP